MLSLKERLELLESDLAATPPRISVYRDLPFAIVRYDPGDEWRLREELRRLRTRLEGRGVLKKLFQRRRHEIARESGTSIRLIRVFPTDPEQK